MDCSWRSKISISVALFLMFFSAATTIKAAPSIPPTITPGGLLQYTGYSTFYSAFRGFPVEDFEESPIADGLYDLSCTGPINSSTNQPPNCFVPGDILSGIAIDAQPSHQMVVNGVGTGTLTTTSVTIGSSSGADIMALTFSGGGVNAVGMNLVGYSGGISYEVKIYGAGNTLLDTITTETVTTAGTFYGWYSEKPITKITLDTGGSFELIDNVRFGSVDANLKFYGSQSDFEAGNTALVLENFNESPISNGNAMIMDEPVNSSTNAPGGFAPGDIAEGLSIRTVAQPGTSSLILYGAYFGSLGNDSVLMGIFSPAHDLKVSFYDNQTYAAGMNLMLDQADDALAVIYGPYGKLLGTKSIALLKTKTFFGVQANQPLSGIAVMNADRIELFDDIQFGGASQNLTFYSNPTAFNKTASRFQMEDFSESPVLPSPALPLKCDEPFSNSTNNSCFAPGDIQAGISFSTLHGTYCPECLYVYGEDSLCSGNPKSILAPTDNLNIVFSQPVNRVGLNVYGADFFVYVYDQNDHILGAGYVHSLSCPGVFLGISSRLKISRILLGDLGTAIFLQDIRFGYYFPWPMFSPAFSSD